MLELERAALEKLSDSMGQMITLGASTIPSSYLLPPILSGYRSENAGCFFRVLQSDSHTAVSQVLDGTVDFSVVGEVPDNPALTIREICRDQLLIVTPVNEHYMTLKHHTPSLQQLFQEPVISVNPAPEHRKTLIVFWNVTIFTRRICMSLPVPTIWRRSAR